MPKAAVKTSKQNGGPRKGAGRKEVAIPLPQLRKLCKLRCTLAEIGNFFGVSHVAITQRMQRDPQFAKIIEKGWANGKISIRRSQARLLAKDNPQMAVHLGKVYLDQRDSKATTEFAPVSQEVQKEITEAIGTWLDMMHEIQRRAAPPVEQVPQPSNVIDIAPASEQQSASDDIASLVRRKRAPTLRLLPTSGDVQ